MARVRFSARAFIFFFLKSGNSWLLTKETNSLKLGILVNTDRHAEDLVGVAKAAISKGHQVIVFFMDDGVKLLNDAGVAGLSENTDIDMSYCDYTTQEIGLSKEGFPEKIVCGSQYNNAIMNHEADRVIVI